MQYSALTGMTKTIAHVGDMRLYMSKNFNWYKSKTETYYHVEADKTYEAGETDNRNRYNFTNRKAANTYLCSLIKE